MKIGREKWPAREKSGAAKGGSTCLGEIGTVFSPATGFMDTKQIFLGAVVLLYVVGVLFMRNTHPYRGSRSEPFEAKQKRRRIGVFLISFATLLLGIGGLIQILVSKN